jgi:hypothetical protein
LVHKYWSEEKDVLSPILFNAMKDEIANKVTGENKRPDTKTFIFANNVLISGKNEKET